MAADLVGKPYAFIIDKPHRWSSWAAPKKADGSFDHDTALTGDDLIAYVNDELFPYLIQVVKPKIGERIYDGALGSAGFLCEAYDYLRHGDLTTKPAPASRMSSRS